MYFTTNTMQSVTNQAQVPKKGDLIVSNLKKVHIGYLWKTSRDFVVVCGG